MFVKCVQFTLFLGLVASTLGNAVLNRDGLFTQIGNGYYYIAHENYTKWFNAYEDCRRMGSELITIDTIEEWHAINKYLNNMNIMKSYWTSGNDLAETGKHVWFSNGEPITLDIWAPGQPDNYQNREHCDMLGWYSKGQDIPQLNDGGCDGIISYICEASSLHAQQII